MYRKRVFYLEMRDTCVNRSVKVGANSALVATEGNVC